MWRFIWNNVRSGGRFCQVCNQFSGSRYVGQVRDYSWVRHRMNTGCALSSRQSEPHLRVSSFLAAIVPPLCFFGLLLGLMVGMCAFNTLRTDDADLRFYITIVQDGWRKSAFLKSAWFPCTVNLIMQYTEPDSEWSWWRMFIETWPHSELTFRHRASSI